jgi:hypothetical protein
LGDSATSRSLKGGSSGDHRSARLTLEQAVTRTG